MTPSQLYSRILPHVPGCPEPTVDQAVMDAVIELCDRSKVDVRVEETIELEEGQADYELFGDDGLDQDSIRGVYGPLGEITHATPSRLQDVMPSWQTMTAPVPSYYATWHTPGALTFFPTPDQSGASVRVVAVWRPAMDATSFPDDLGRRYYQCIVDGAKAKLMSMPNVKWANLQLAAIADRSFRNGIEDARADAIRGQAFGSLTARPVAFGR